jgi:hypothetical protein
VKTDQKGFNLSIKKEIPSCPSVLKNLRTWLMGYVGQRPYYRAAMFANEKQRAIFADPDAARQGYLDCSGELQPSIMGFFN